MGGGGGHTCNLKISQRQKDQKEELFSMKTRKITGQSGESYWEGGCGILELDKPTAGGQGERQRSGLGYIILKNMEWGIQRLGTHREVDAERHSGMEMTTLCNKYFIYVLRVIKRRHDLLFIFFLLCFPRRKNKALFPL